MDPGARFVEFANPHGWLLVADNLHEQAMALYRERGGTLTHIRRNQPPQTRFLVNRSVFLLGGFALENAVKAFLVYENPNWISNGRLSRELRSHSLTTLQQKAKLVPYKRQYLWVLRAFEQGLESWARYPCGLGVEDPAEEALIERRLWMGYLRLMRAYGSRLQALLSAEWKGPHGFVGRFTFTGEFLSTRQAG